MVNYYEELGLDRSFGLDELKRQLSRVESVWKARRTRSPEKATKMLAIIVDARAVFSASATRATYDHELDMAKSASNVDDNESVYSQRFIE